MSGFPYVFADYKAKLYDLRNKDDCPSYNNMIKKVSFIFINIIIIRI